MLPTISKKIRSLNRLHRVLNAELHSYIVGLRRILFQEPRLLQLDGTTPTFHNLVIILVY
jgi:hypothetical protein